MRDARVIQQIESAMNEGRIPITKSIVMRGIHMKITCVGIDVSDGHSTISAYAWGDVMLMKPQDVPHTVDALHGLADEIGRLPGEVRVVMEHTGRCWLPIAGVLREAGLFVSAVNPKLIRDFGDNKLRSLKTDKADSRKIARYGLRYWNELQPYAPTETTRQKLLEFSRQLDNSNKLLTAQKNNLQAIVSVTFPGVRKLFTSPAREDGRIKWVDFVCDFYHCDRVRKLGAAAFTECYRAWCKRKGYNFTKYGCAKIYALACNCVPSLSCDRDTKLLINEVARQLTAISVAVEVFRAKIYDLASTLPEFGCVMAMFGCGKTTGPQLMAEIGDPTRFRDRVVDGRRIKGKKQLAQFAGVAPGNNQSGSYEQQSVKASKKGSANLRRTLFQIISTHLKKMPDNPIYHFLDRKRVEGKEYFVYMTAASNRFLQRYYAQVRDYLAAQPVDPPSPSIAA
ncbi:MAG: IS110 family transposase [Clostridiales bacterium]|nr:IS110 family transposase [Clostridiales bacterium]